MVLLAAHSISNNSLLLPSVRKHGDEMVSQLLLQASENAERFLCYPLTVGWDSFAYQIAAQPTKTVCSFFVNLLYRKVDLVSDRERLAGSCFLQWRDSRT